MCGVVGIVGPEPVAPGLYDALTVLQHRGQDAAGIMTSDGKRINARKGNGLVRDVFHQQHMNSLQGTMGLGHVRYPTAGGSNVLQAQPFYVNSPYGICLAHNGNLTNAKELEQLLVQKDMRHLSTDSDSELLLNVFAHELQAYASPSLSAEDVFKAVEGVYRRCRGGYAVVMMIVGFGIVAFRDPHGIRPLVIGRRQTSTGVEHIVASESVATDVLGYEFLRDVAPGEAVYIETNGRFHASQCAPMIKHSPCIFEFVYFARPDSIIDGVSVYKVRLRMGEKLAEKIKREWPDHDIDVVVPIPDTSRTAAQTVAYRLNVKNREGFMKNRYIGRTFIMPGQKERKKSVRRKLNAIDLEFRGKNVLLVDDSIVRGTTSKQIIQMARDAGARRVYFASAAPPVRYPNVYGIDMPSPHELMGHGRSEQDIADLIGADRLFYQDLRDLEESCYYENSKISNFDTSCFSGTYVTGDITPDYLDQVDQMRNDAAKQKRLAAANDDQSEVSGLA